MPLGVTACVLSVALGGLIGGLLGNRIPQRLRDTLPVTFSFCAILLGISLVVQINATSPVVLCLILGTVAGELLRLEDLAVAGVKRAYGLVFANKAPDENYMNQFMTVTVLFCFSAMGIFGALTEGFSGDSSVLLSKSIMDFFTAMIFACVLNAFVAAISIPQALIFYGLFFGGTLLMPFITDTMLADFKALGGVITIMVGFRMSGLLRDLRLVNTLPGLIMVLPVSHIWTMLMG